ncbi:peptidase inhibitor family I36 protein [Streptomyces sp. NPDC097610]|uniref:peptidase inhibitor family I36 protein n=1 Tax=Streptomyces sp. NPDC097610 TaxID=3157227 RepID=UPI00332FDB1D
MHLKKTIVMVAMGAALTATVSATPAQATVADTSCASGEFCDWTGANYTGSKAVSSALPGVCYHGTVTKSVKNNTSRQVVLYRNSTCTSSDVVIVGARQWMPTLPWTIHSYQA